MKVLLINGSVHLNGTTKATLNIVAEKLNNNGIETEIIDIGGDPIRDCMSCGKCKDGSGRCAFNDDIVNRFLEKAEGADGFVFGTPVYYSHPAGRLLDFMDRVFYAGGKVMKHKPVFSLAVARRTGSVASIDVMNKHFTISQMPVISSTYWNQTHGSKGEDVVKDEEGVETMLNAAENMAWILKCIEAGKKQNIFPPNTVKTKRTNFIR